MTIGFHRKNIIFQDDWILQQAYIYPPVPSYILTEAW